MSLGHLIAQGTVGASSRGSGSGGIDVGADGEPGGDGVVVCTGDTEAIPSKDEGGKLIVIDMMMENEKQDIESLETQLMWDMLMMVVLAGKERNEKEWRKLFLDAGFNDYKIHSVHGLRQTYQQVYTRPVLEGLTSTFIEKTKDEKHSLDQATHVQEEQVAVVIEVWYIKPEITQNLRISEKAHAVDWSDELESGKAVRLSGLCDKLGYRVRKAFSVESVKCSFSTEHCSLRYDDGRVASLHFLIQSTRKDVPVVQPDGSGFDYGNRNTPVALQVQKEIFLLPTIHMPKINSDKIGKPEIITCGSTVNLYANPASLFITVTLAAFNSSSKPVNSGDWVRKLQKQKDDVHGLNIGLEFGSGKYCAILRDEVENLGSEVSPDLGSVLPPKSTKSWFMKYSKVHLKLLVEKASEALLDLDALSGFTEIVLKTEEGPALTYITRLDH
ncbi:hypothetical protein RJ640_015723 [Escallonia rubra]|uniref:O-methyltransferase C-terminal domain-containing protein n=1 Tax=Escallonia rubra TaxID=112253 RepID=A0AA88RNL2_9ASTE|nr:hypothetical protein RJ640_015723 [Escallonia rubra]